MDEELFAVYRRTRDEDTDCDRAIRMRDDGVEIRAGRTGQATALTQVRRENCWANDPWREMKCRCNEWIRQGFRLIGYGGYVDGRLRLVHELEAAPQDAKPKDARLALHWGTNAAFSAGALEDTFLDIAKALRRENIPAGVRSRYVEGHTGLWVETPNRTWSLRLQPTGVLSEAGQQGNAARLLAADGTVPFLVLLRIEQVFPGSLEFVWIEQTDAWAVQPTLAPDDPYLGEAAGPFERTLRVAQAIGVIPEAQVSIAGSQDDRPIFF